MAGIPIPGVNTPTYQSWGASVAQALNERRTMTSVTQVGNSDSPATLGPWPDQNTKTIQVPSWATSVFVINKLNGIYPQNSDIYFQVNLNIDGSVVEVSKFAYVLNTVARYELVMTGTKDVSAERGSNVVMTNALRITGTGWVRSDSNCHFTMDIDFRP